MTIPHITIKAFKGAAFAGALFVTAASSQAAFTPVPFGSSNIAIGSENGASMTGTILASYTSTFTDSSLIPAFTGTLSSYVVDRGGGLLDFYYQVVNNTAPSLVVGGFEDFSEITRFDIVGGFVENKSGGPLTTDAANNTTNTVGSLPSAGTEVGLTADRDAGGLGNFAFDFGTPLGVNPPALSPGQTSQWLVVRTNATEYFSTVAFASSGGGASNQFSVFAPIPEPTTVGFGIAMIGVCVSSALGRRRAAK